MLTDLTQLGASMPESSHPTPPSRAQGTEKALWVRNEPAQGKFNTLERKSADEEYTL